MKKILLSALLVSCGLNLNAADTSVALAPVVAQPATKPNIIYILADDLGYGDLGCYGSKLNATPNLDRMATDGIRFTDFHAGSWCLPSRVGLMTGTHAARPGLMAKNAPRMAERITIAEMLKKQGYATALFGKWHLGMGKGTHPLDQGFDYWYGTVGSNDWNGPGYNYADFRDTPEEGWKTPRMVNREQQGVIDQSQFTREYTKETLQFIRENKKKPFFIYLSHNMPHVPVFASEAFKGKSRNGVYGDVIMELDWSVGQVLKALEKEGLSENTLVVFTSDNGPWKMFGEFGGDSGPLHGEKSTTWEGGQRVPAIFYWPKKIKPSVSPAFVANTDVYATLAAITGSTVEEGQAIDSHDQSGVLLSGAASPRTELISYHHGQPLAYRNGKYKIHFFTRERTRDPETGKAEPSVPCNPPLLFDMKKDPAESKNITAEHPELVDRLTREYKQAAAAIREWKKL
jgi:arylsulfatase A